MEKTKQSSAAIFSKYYHIFLYSLVNETDQAVDLTLFPSHPTRTGDLYILLMLPTKEPVHHMYDRRSMRPSDNGVNKPEG